MHAGRLRADRGGVFGGEFVGVRKHMRDCFYEYARCLLAAVGTFDLRHLECVAISERFEDFGRFNTMDDLHDAIGELVCLRHLRHRQSPIALT